MRRRHGTAVALIGMVAAMCWTASAEGASLTLAAQPLSLSPGEPVETSVFYSPGGALLSTIQFDLLFVDVALTNDFAAGSAATAAGKDVTLLNVFIGGATLSISGLNQNVIGNGSVLDITTTLLFGAPSGPYSLDLANSFGTDPNGNRVDITSVNLPATVPAPNMLWPTLGTMISLALWNERRRRERCN